MLNKNEYLKFVTALEASLEEDGELTYKRTKEESTTIFNALNKVDPDVSGITKVDIQEGYKFQQFFLKEGLNPLTKPIKLELMKLADSDMETMQGWDAAVVAKAKAAEARMCSAEQRRVMTDAFVRIFEEADQDKDTYLDKSEYFTFCAKMKAF